MGMNASSRDKPTERRASLGRLDQIQPVLLIAAIGVGLGLAWSAPTFAAGSGWLVKTGVFLVIYLVMLGVDERGVLRAFTRLKPTSIALAINFLFTPLFAWFLGVIFLRGHPDIWVGLILYLVTPCIGWYLVFTDLADGDVELGVSLLFWNIALQILLLPVYLYLLAGRIVSVDIAGLLQSLGLFLVLPYALAFLTRRIWQARAVGEARMSDRLPISLMKTVTLMTVIAAMFASQGSVLFDNPGIVLLMIGPGLVFFAAIFVIAIGVSRAARLTYPETALMVFTTAARNSEVSLAVAVTAFTSPLIALTVVIGPAIELPILVAMLKLLAWMRQGNLFAAASR
jgi:ACR3 family arsenite efflux pump ArsB